MYLIMKNYSSQKFQTDLESGAFTDIGCYPKYFITSDGESLSYESAQKNFKLIVDAIDGNSNCGWRVVGCDVNWEHRLYCCDTNKPIQSAYDPIDEA